MRVFFDARLLRRVLLLSTLAVAASGCSRLKYRTQADRDAYGVIAERNGDPRWNAPTVKIDLDPCSRYFDPYDPDRPPMPLDDPASQQYMKIVDGKRGWKHWGDNGFRRELENPEWKNALVSYVETDDEGALKLDVDSAVKLAYVHSPQHQRQLETLYLTALDVSGERFRLDTQFFGGYDANYTHNGSLVPAALAYDNAAGKFVVTQPVDVDGLETNRLTVGRPSVGNPALQLQKRFATAGDLLIGFANSFVFEFTGGDANLSASLANFSFIQPLLRGAGKDIALEQLTFEERKLLANLRAYGQFRQGFYTQVAIGELGVTGPQRGGGSTSLQSFSGSGSNGGYLGLLQQRQQIRNDEDNLNLQLRTFARLQALYDNDLIDLVQVDQFEQDIERTRARLLRSRNNLQLSLDRFKTSTLGLPPDLAIEIDESLIRQFQLIPREAAAIQDDIIKVQSRVGKVFRIMDPLFRIAGLQNQLGGLGDDTAVADVRELLVKTRLRIGAVQRRLDEVYEDIPRLDSTRGPEMTPAEKSLINTAREKLRQRDELETEFRQSRLKLQDLQDKLTAETKVATIRDNADWIGEQLRLCQGCLVIQARVHRLDVEPTRVISDLSKFIEPVRQVFEDVKKDLDQMDEKAPERLRSMTDKERTNFQTERKRLDKRYSDRRGEYDALVRELKMLHDGLNAETRHKTTRALVGWVAGYLRVTQRLLLVPARARLESIAVDFIKLNTDDAMRLALSNRLDFMNGRAALVDQWRLIQVNADALQSVVNITASGDIRTAKNNPFSFRAPTGTARLGLEFDAPLTRLLERNSYRESLIEYQRSRRALIQSRDSLHLGIRALLRQVEQSRQDLEIQRRAVTIAIRRVDQTQLELNEPRDAPEPGSRPPINRTQSIQLLGAQQALRDSQNAFLGAWLDYYAVRMRLYRELGIMTLDPEGHWIEHPVDTSMFGPTDGGDSKFEELPLPEPLPASWMELAAPNVSVAGRPVELRRLPPTDN